MKFADPPASTPAHLKKWVASAVKLCRPQKIYWMNGSPHERKKLEAEAVKQGLLVPLNPQKRPGSFYHRSHPNDVARVEQQTFICTPSKHQTGPTNNWMNPARAYSKARSIFKGSMTGRTLYVIPFSMGRPGSPFARLGVQLTDSLYVALNMRIMTHVGQVALRHLGRSTPFTRCLHATADLNPDQRLILHFPQDNTIWSVNSGYGGNALLGKKCMALRIASSMGHREGWLAEHMLILGLEDPSGRRTYMAAAFPSACGKTNLAMLTPPPRFKKAGYKIWTIGDDIAWLRIDESGALRATNPETGFFGVVPGTNSQTNPNAVRMIRRNTIFTNTLLTKDGDVWWEGADERPPRSGTNWQGRPWHPGLTGPTGEPVWGAHPNSRFTVPAEQTPSFDENFWDPKGVKISAIIFGGRQSYFSPLVCEARSWPHGVYLGATMSSETTAAQSGAMGRLRYDPMAMRPFCGYHMGTYWQHWLTLGQKMPFPPKIFRVNWFRRNRTGRFLWPGFGENIRVLKWIADRVHGHVTAQDSLMGLVPNRREFDLRGLRLPPRTWSSLFEVNHTTWADELNRQKDHFRQFKPHLPSALKTERRRTAQRFKTKFQP